MNTAGLGLVGVVAHLAIELILIVRVMTRPHRDPASRVAWIAVIATLPFVGIAAYLLFGETSVGRRRIRRIRAIIQQMPPPAEINEQDREKNGAAVISDRYQQLFQTGKSVNGFERIGGNTARLMADSNSTIRCMVEDIDSATKYVHLLFYIWLPDNNGLKIVDSLKRAAARGVKCRAMVDDLGSRTMIRSEHWNELQAAGVSLARALPIGNPLLRPFHGRIDLRNHRKIVVIDGRVTYCGSQNCADPEFLVKAKYAPWVDAVLRIEGPIVRQNQYLFAMDWMSSSDENLDDLLSEPLSPCNKGFSAQVIGTGPTFRFSAMPEVFQSLFHAARNQLTITTPYYVPNESMQDAICAAAWRGVKTTMVFPARNDSWIVGAASRSYYRELLEAGVQIYEYVGGLLHTKSVTLDGDVTLIGSANMDRRSFDLNYENNILLYDPDITSQVHARQEKYIAESQRVTLDDVASWSLARRFRNNSLATLGPIL